MTANAGGQLSPWAKAGELLSQECNQAGAIVRMTGERTGLIYENGSIYLYRFCRRKSDRRPRWYLEAKRDEVGKLAFRSKRASFNYGMVMPTVDPADFDLMRRSFKQHVTDTRAYRREAKRQELKHRGTAMSRGAGWVRSHRGDWQDACMFFPGAVFRSPAKVTYNFTQMTAARAMLLETQGNPTDESHVVRHKCGMGHMSCINPAHLAWGTAADNGRDMSLHNRTVYDPREYSADLLAKVSRDPRLTKVIAWDLNIPAALVSAIKLATAQALP